MEPVLLLVEDSHFDIELLQHAFKKAGLIQPLQVVRDGVDAMSYLLGVGEFSDRERFPMPHILLMDLNMPRFSGLEFLAWMRNQPEFLHLMVVVLSGTVRQLDIDQAYKMGAKSYLVKPTRADELQKVVNAFYNYWIALNHFPMSEPGPERRAVLV